MDLFKLSQDEDLHYWNALKLRTLFLREIFYMFNNYLYISKDFKSIYDSI